jgi:hypothetical protein
MQLLRKILGWILGALGVGIVVLTVVAAFCNKEAQATVGQRVVGVVIVFFVGSGIAALGAHIFPESGDAKTSSPNSQKQKVPYQVPAWIKDAARQAGSPVHEGTMSLAWGQVKQQYGKCISGDLVDDHTFSKARLHTSYRDHAHADSVLNRIADNTAAALRPTNEGMSSQRGSPKYHVVHEGVLTGKQIKDYLVTVVNGGGEIWEVLV